MLEALKNSSMSSERLLLSYDDLYCQPFSKG